MWRGGPLERFRWRPRGDFFIGLLIGVWTASVLVITHYKGGSDTNVRNTGSPLIDAMERRVLKERSPEDKFLLESTIMVGIGAFRDPLCQDTVWSALSMAVNVSRVWLSVYQQYKPGEPDEDCLKFQNIVCPPLNNTAIVQASDGDKQERPYYKASPQEWAYVCNALGQVITQRVDWMTGAGPTVARHYTQAAMGDNIDFFLQVDSHSTFVMGWDVEILRQWKATNDPNAVLSTYPRPHDKMPQWLQHVTPAQLKQDPTLLPPAFLDVSGFNWNYRVVWHPNSEVSWLPTYIPDFISVICHAVFVGDLQMPRNDAAGYFTNRGKPYAGAFWGAGLGFFPAQAVRDCMYDKYTPYLFDGEEMSMAVRLYTHGYNLYAPFVDIVFHVYGSSPGVKRVKYWDVDWQARTKVQAKSQERIRYVLRLPNKLDFDRTDIEKYDLGTNRSLSDYESVSGVTFAKQESVRICDEISEHRFPDVAHRPPPPPPTTSASP